MTQDSQAPPPEFSFPVDILGIPSSGRSYTIAANEEARARVAERLDLQNVNSLRATLEVSSAPGGIIKAVGRITAEVTQTCVVSLVPVPASVNEAIDVAFITEEKAEKDRLAKEKAKRLRTGKSPAEEEELDPDLEEPPEVAVGGRIDLGEAAVVQLALSLNPYPRAPGAAFDPKAWGMEPEKPKNAPQTSPFAALAKLKSPSPKGGPN